MAEALLVVASNDLIKVATASVPTAFPATVPTVTAPTAGILGIGYQQGNRSISLMPYTSASTGGTYAMRLIGWSPYTSTSGAIWYMPTILANVTLATQQAGYSIDGTNDVYPFATITNAATTNPTISLAPDIYTVGTASGGGASIVVATSGPRILQVQFTASTGAPTLGVFARTL
jgi:hypothetical protein